MSRDRANSAEDESVLLRRAVAWPGHLTLDALGEEGLSEITRAEGIDFATALLFERFQRSSRHADFIRHFDALRRQPSSSKFQTDVKVVIVPGALYKERPDFGGDGRLVREVAHEFGCATDLVPVASFGSIGENARLIRNWMEQHRKERMILVSLSKGGADLKMALAAPDASALFGNVVAWINVCGPLHGSRMADWVLGSWWRRSFFRVKFWCQRRDFGFVTSLSHEASAVLAAPVCLPPTMPMISLIGFPMQRHMTSRFSRFCHRTLGVDGPNDGTTLLADAVRWPGDIYPAWGMDHYFRPESASRNLIAATLHHLAAPAGSTAGERL